jgi:hypothetical protein
MEVLEIMPRKMAFTPSAAIQSIRAKLETDPSGQTLTEAEKEREVFKEEAAYLLSVLAGRVISQRYVKELTREDKGARLKPVNIIGSTFIYKVADLLHLKFNNMEKKGTD